MDRPIPLSQNITVPFRGIDQVFALGEIAPKCLHQAQLFWNAHYLKIYGRWHRLKVAEKKGYQFVILVLLTGCLDNAFEI